MSNRVIVHYVLRRLGNIKDVHVTESQIDRYYRNLPQYNEQRENDPTHLKIDALADHLCKYSFEKNILAHKGDIILNTKSSIINDKVEHMKALTGLYLTVAYIAIKNLIKANARYYIAFSIFERDYAMFNKKLGGSTLKDYHLSFPLPNGKTGENEGFALIEHLLDNDEEDQWRKYDWDDAKSHQENLQALRRHIKDYKKNKHFKGKWRDIFRKEIDAAKKVSATGYLLTSARNDAAHLRMLEVIPDYVTDFRKDVKGEMQSYFELYHFLLQKRMIDKETELLDITVNDYAKRIAEYQTACKDLVNVTYVSLAYNLPRYKNLTCEALFDEDSVAGKNRNDATSHIDKAKKFWGKSQFEEAIQEVHQALKLIPNEPGFTKLLNNLTERKEKPNQ